MIRVIDFIIALSGLIFGIPILMLLWILVWIDNRSPIYRQRRVGRHQKGFYLVKFRTMRIGTPLVATHLLDTAAVTKMGRLLRRSKLDELPQLWNVLCGHMSLVGPRPCLYSQRDLIKERACRGVFSARPGLTGLAQIKNIDMSTPQLLAEVDAQMLRNMSTKKYFYYIIKTIMGAGQGDRIR